jgi:hypothetical protein
VEGLTQSAFGVFEVNAKAVNTMTVDFESWNLDHSGTLVGNPSRPFRPKTLSKSTS